MKIIIGWIIFSFIILFIWYYKLYVIDINKKKKAILKQFRENLSVNQRVSYTYKTPYKNDFKVDYGTIASIEDREITVLWFSIMTKVDIENVYPFDWFKDKSWA